MIDYAQSDKYYKKFLIETMAFSAKNKNSREKFLNYLKEHQKTDRTYKRRCEERRNFSPKDSSIISQEIDNLSSFLHIIHVLFNNSFTKY